MTPPIQIRTTYTEPDTRPLTEEERLRAEILRLRKTVDTLTRLILELGEAAKSVVK